VIRYLANLTFLYNGTDKKSPRNIEFPFEERDEAVPGVRDGLVDAYGMTASADPRLRPIAHPAVSAVPEKLDHSPYFIKLWKVTASL